MQILKRLGKFFLDIFQTVVVSLAVFVILYQFAIQPHRVSGSSMEPNYHNGEYILTEKVSYYFHEPQRGDVIVFKFPLDKDFDYIKRIIALPGETVTIRENHIFINGRELKESYLSPGTFTTGHSAIPSGVTYTVPQGSYVVMGDNRERSSDSREWGPVPRENIIGRAFLRYWPPSKIGLTESAAQKHL